MVPENIHAPTTEGIGNSEGVGKRERERGGGGARTQEILEGRGLDGQIIFQMSFFDMENSS